MITPFKNEPFTDYSKPENKQAMDQAIQMVRSQFGKTYPLIIDGKEITGLETFPSTNPSKKSEILGTFQKGTKEHLEAAINAAWKAFESWSKTSAQERADIFFKAAAEIRKRKHEFSAWLALEVGKTWPEADADTAETIDFIEFYSREMLRLAEKQPLVPISGEKNELVYIPLGVGSIIPPWNFPLAICVGMAVGAMVAGNCVILKPASDAPGVAYQFAKLMHDLGLPKGVLNYVTGSGSQIGDAMVLHPKIRFISFTGSKEVGLRINELAAKTQPGQKWIKRVVAEMGGKDSIVVDADADPEAAATAITASAFGYQGQKCSACSRAIVHEKIYDDVLDRVKKKAEALKIGPTAEGTTQFGPCVNASQYKTVLNYIEVGKKEGRLITGGKPLSEEGYFIAPTILADVSPTARISQEEIFGPVLAFTKVKSFEEGLQAANNTEFGLTGALFTNNRQHIERAKKDFFVGNLYFNRKCTGALVGVHPFGGFNMSGTDSKAGGRDYLLLFLQPKLMSEKL